MAATLYLTGDYRVWFNDNSTIEVTVGGDDNGFLVTADQPCITTSNVRFCFGKQIVKVERL